MTLRIILSFVADRLNGLVASILVLRIHLRSWKDGGLAHDDHHDHASSLLHLISSKLPQLQLLSLH